VNLANRKKLLIRVKRVQPSKVCTIINAYKIKGVNARAKQCYRIKK